MQITFTPARALPEPELTLDPLAGTTGYRVQTDLQAGDCFGSNNDGCVAGTEMGKDLKGNATCVACLVGAP